MIADIVGSLAFYCERSQRLALGTRSVVCKGTHIGGDVAVQRIEIEFADIDIRELSKIRYHHHIAGFICAEKDKHFHYIATEFCPYTLVDYLAEGYRGQRFEKRKILSEITQGLSFLHGLGLTHRKIRPSNILISKLNRFKLRISHLAIRWKSPSKYEDCFESNTTCVAPELYRKPEEYSPASDIFDLGCLFSYLLFGSHPFGEYSERQANINKKLVRLLEDDTSDPKAIQLISKMIKYDPAGRPTAAEVLSDPYLHQRAVGNFVPHLDARDKIGDGSYGTTVYAYNWNGLNVAIKKINKSLVVDYQKEIEVLQNRLTLQSPHLIHYYSHAEDGDHCYIFMELCETNVQRLIESNRYWPDRDFLKQIVIGLDYLHSMNFIHRDIKPSNVLVARDSRDKLIPKLADFGISKTATSSGSDDTKNCRGSMGWIAPELCEGPQEDATVVYNKSVDIFSAGCLFHYIQSRGLHPFQGLVVKQKLNFNDCNFNIQKYGRGEGTYNLSSLLDYDLKDLIERMIEKEPQKRITTTEILSHPCFWKPEESLNYIIAAVDRRLKNEKHKDKQAKGSSPLINLLEHNSHTVTSGDWKAKLSRIIQGKVDVGQGGKKKNPIYDSTSIYDLLLCIRDKHAHFAELSPELQMEYGDPPYHYWRTWIRRFPQLLIHTWKVLEGKVEMPPKLPKRTGSTTSTNANKTSYRRNLSHENSESPPQIPKFKSGTNSSHSTQRPTSAVLGKGDHRNANEMDSTKSILSSSIQGKETEGASKAMRLKNTGDEKNGPKQCVVSISMHKRERREEHAETANPSPKSPKCEPHGKRGDGPMEGRSDIAEEFVRKSALLERGPPSIYCLPMTRRSDKNQVQWFDIGTRHDNVPHKTIFLVGCSKSGKTTLVNAMVNYILGTKWDSPYRFTLTQKEESTTSLVAYSVHHRTGFKIPFSLTIVDTPTNTDIRILQQFLLTSEARIESYNAVYLVSKVEQLRDEQIRFFNSVLSTFQTNPQELNVRLLLTLWKPNLSPEITSYYQRIFTTKNRNSNILCYYFNNSCIWRQNAVGSSEPKMYYDFSSLSLQKVFEDLGALLDQKLEPIRKRVRSELRNRALRSTIQVDVDEYALNCSKCQRTCRLFKGHRNQSMPNLSKGACPYCNCGSESHSLESYRWVQEQMNEVPWMTKAQQFQQNWSKRIGDSSLSKQSVRPKSVSEFSM